MKILKHIFNFYINASIHVALAVVALTWVTLIQLEMAINFNLLAFVFFATISAYNFVKYFGLAKFHHRRLANWLKEIQIFSLIAFLLMCYYFFQLQFYTQSVIMILGVITFFYAIPFIPKSYLLDDKMNLRQISGLKIYIIALVWTFVTVILPVIEFRFEINTSVLIISIQRFLYILILMLPFEIRDFNYDNLKLGTIPQKIGVRNTKLVGILLLSLFIGLEFLIPQAKSNFMVLGILGLVSLFFIWFSNQNQSKYYASFWVEALPILWLLLILIFC